VVQTRRLYRDRRGSVFLQMPSPSRRFRHANPTSSLFVTPATPCLLNRVQCRHFRQLSPDCQPRPLFLPTGSQPGLTTTTKRSHGSSCSTLSFRCTVALFESARKLANLRRLEPQLACLIASWMTLSKRTGSERVSAAISRGLKTCSAEVSKESVFGFDERCVAGKRSEMVIILDGLDGCRSLFLGARTSVPSFLPPIASVGAKVRTVPESTASRGGYCSISVPLGHSPWVATLTSLN
jgi:hypothetical protein